MTIFDDLADIARERHFGHETSNATERELCRISRVPVLWCHGCRKGLHKYTRVPLPGAEDFELPVAEVVAVEVAPVEITPVDATPPVIDPPSVKLSEIITDVASQALGVPRERIDCSALDTEIVGIVERALKDGVDEGRKP